MIAQAEAIDTLETDLADIANEINSLHRTITVDGAMRIGERLDAVNSELANRKNGTFGKWVKEKLTLSRTAAFRYMSVYRRFGDSEYRSSLEQHDFSVDSIYELARQPEEIVAEAVDRAEAGERITLAKVKELTDETPVAPNEPLALSDAMLRLQRVLRGVMKWFPAEHKDALANRLLSAGDEILTTGGIR
jgi:hypothetical protein